jgi:predicted lipid-binding transport protein (Tim44 family)
MALFGRRISADDQAIARYHYMLKTASPETIEEMGERIPAAERAQVERGGTTPEALARAATRAEMRQPGSLGGMMAGSLLSGIAGAVIGSMIAQHFFSANGADVADSGGDSDVADASGFDDIGGGFDV